MPSFADKMSSLLRRKPQPRPIIANELTASEFRHVALPPLPDVPGMISPAEARYLYWLTSEVYKGRGAVIEVGTWLGRSTVHLAAGLRAAHPGKKLKCFDHFEWAGGANWPQAACNRHERGSDFMPDFLQNTKDFSDVIDAKRCKIHDLVLTNSEVGIMVLDAPKRVADVSAILTQLSGRVVPGQTILAWQDFMHGPSFEIPACLFAIADHLEPVHVVTEGCLAAFRVRSSWSRREVSARSLSLDRWSVDQARIAWDYWMPVIPEPLRPLFRVGLAMLLHDIGRAKAATEEFLAVAKDPKVQLSMDKWSRTSLGKRYSPLFQAIT